MCVSAYMYMYAAFAFLVCIYVRVCPQSLGGCVCGYVYTHRDCMCLCSYMCVRTQRSMFCAYVDGVYMDVCTYNDSQCVYTCEGYGLRCKCKTM